MNWDDIRVFLALCREGSVSGAGRVLGVNHTTVARRVQSLEGALGTRLFDRTPEGYAMTQAAENMFDLALQMEEQALAIDRRIFGRDATLCGRLRLTVPYDFANNVLMPAMAQFRAMYPGIDVELLATTDLMDLAARQADIAVRLTARPPDYLVGRMALPLRHGVYGSAEYLERWSGEGGEPQVVLFRRDDPLPDWVARHFPEATVALRTDNASSMLAAVRNGLGVARMPCFVADVDPAMRRLERALEPSSWGIWVLSHEDLRATARVRVCREFLFEAIEARRALILGEQSRYHRE